MSKLRAFLIQPARLQKWLAIDIGFSLAYALLFPLMIYVALPAYIRMHSPGKTTEHVLPIALAFGIFFLAKAWAGFKTRQRSGLGLIILLLLSLPQLLWAGFLFGSLVLAGSGLGGILTTLIFISLFSGSSCVVLILLAAHYWPGRT